SVLAICTLLALSFAMSTSAGAQTISSAYTSTALKNCRAIGARNSEDGSVARICPGKAGLVVLVNEDDLRETVSVGRDRADAAKQPAAEAWFGPFNSPTSTVEWRIQDGKPFAIIQRWHIADNSDQDRDGRPKDKVMLAVTRLPPGAVCHVAYIDV